jgi:hypothetical protein
MPVDDIERLHFYQRQYLGAEDLEAQQTYHRDMRRRHNLGQHTWGIVVGFELIETPRDGDPGGVDVYITRGMAVDAFGREIVLLDAVKLDPALFSGFANSQHRSVWIRYFDEAAGQPKYGWKVCDENNQYSRIVETFRVVVEPDPAKLADPITVSGVAAKAADLPLDGSAPYQEFPDDESDPRWLIRLGSVNWDGTKGKFIPAATGKLSDSRRYVSLVGQEVLAPATSLLVRARDIAHPLPTDPESPDYMGVTAELDGTLQVNRTLFAKADVELHGGKLYFRNENGEDLNVPLWMQRLQGPDGKSTADLRIHLGDGKIGEVASAAARLTVGNLNSAGNAESIIFDVKGDNTVDIPTGTLSFGQMNRQMINLWTSSLNEPLYGIGVQAGTQYFRTHNQFCWFRDGTHSDKAADAGGGTLQLRLDSNGLFFGNDTKQMLNLWGTNYGIGVQDSTHYSRTDAHFNWYRGGVHSDSEGDNGGGQTLMHLTEKGDLHIQRDLYVPGRLRVTGDQNLIKVKTFHRTFGDDPPDNSHAWTINYPGEFAEFYTAFVMVNGFSIFGDPEVINPFEHDSSFGSIPQHVVVRLTQADTDSATGFSYCSRSNPILEGSCQVTFTLVVIGKGVM